MNLVSIVTIPILVFCTAAIHSSFYVIFFYLAAVSSKRFREQHRWGVYTSGLLSVLLKWASTSSNSPAQCSCEPTLHALFFQAAQKRRLIRPSVALTSERFLLPACRRKTPILRAFSAATAYVTST